MFLEIMKFGPNKIYKQIDEHLHLLIVNLKYIGLACISKYPIKHTRLNIWKEVTKILEVNLFAFAYRQFHRDFSSINGTYCMGTHSFFQLYMYFMLIWEGFMNE